MPKGDRDYTAEAIAQFDQTMAEIELTIDTIITTMDLAMLKYRREEVIVSMANIMAERADSKEAACQYLAVACYRIQQMRDTIKKAIQTIDTP